MNKIKAIIFDYDGVIAESVNVKTEAFAELYKPYGNDIVQKVIVHHEANGGVSRFEKFKIYHKNYLGEDIDQLQVDKLAKQFSILVLQKVIDSPYVVGVYDFITSNYQKYDFHISTGTPSDEIEVILNRKSIRKYFKEVYGSPEKKDLHVKKIIKAYGYSNREVVFIGDALTDRDAARNNNISFIGRYTTTEEIKKEKLLIKDFSEIDNII
ncbi:phosphoglycolate phosphatase-like HAD superfamily hydrolase [Lutibacter sp. Hel_I_33_5]|uniref:HAD family hydrolase n=1 Tax=Lutibacter sp. Hel_I_33_5 TaxID=1566289 RepID=UPI0011A20103|nr:HAD hydrolase-like protein [Lutibacter sp. Hel_I_33_5]TVZ55497.1 phosphoglycolate phosphatase-like HAD superfamily hydrolase [Lutibacter sp. Hel_I_33_5]